MIQYANDFYIDAKEFEVNTVIQYNHYRFLLTNNFVVYLHKMQESRLISSVKHLQFFGIPDAECERKTVIQSNHYSSL